MATVLPRLSGSARSPRWVDIFPQSLPPCHASALPGPLPSPPQYGNRGSCLPRWVLLGYLCCGSVVNHPQVIWIEYVLWPPAYTVCLHSTLTGRANTHCSEPFGLALNNELFVADKDKYTLTPAGCVCWFPPSTMPVVSPQEGQVTVYDGGEPHINPLDNCPTCRGTMGSLSINNGFTKKNDAGRLQQSV
jgi:hypothetical protein